MQTFRTAAATLAAAGIDSPLVDARALLAHVLDCAPLEAGFRELTPEQQRHFEELVARRASREPLQHILGTAWFGPLELHVGPGVFIPRPETEVLADWAVGQIPGTSDAGVHVLDLCTGSGALAAYVAKHRPHARIVAVERSAEALSFARRNVPDNVELLQADVLDTQALAPFFGWADVIVCNPPYVPESQDLQPEVYRDPHEAVFSGADGMELIDALAPIIYDLLAPGGVVGLEHDDSTSERVQQTFHLCGLEDVQALKDLTGRARFVIARRGEG